MEKTISNTKNNMNSVPDSSIDLYGLVLAGGQSKRMGSDKALIKYHSKNQLEHAYQLLDQFCIRTFISVSKKNAQEKNRQTLPAIIDKVEFDGPLAGISSALDTFPNSSWLVIACDLPLLDEETLKFLISYRDQKKDATAFISSFNNLPEPLCTIWEVSSKTHIDNALKKELYCPRKILINANTKLLMPIKYNALDNANNLDDRKRINNLLP